MIELTRGDLLTAPTEALVNTVNTVGVMGKGLALQFREAYPAMFQAYRAACAVGEVRLDQMHVFDLGGLVGGPRWIINFPTKETLANPVAELVRVWPLWPSHEPKPHDFGYPANEREWVLKEPLKLLEIHDPPLEAQRRIVAELDAEAAQIEAGRALVPRYEAKIQRVLARVWGTESWARLGLACLSAGGALRPDINWPSPDRPKGCKIRKNIFTVCGCAGEESVKYPG